MIFCKGVKKIYSGFMLHLPEFVSILHCYFWELCLSNIYGGGVQFEDNCGCLKLCHNAAILLGYIYVSFYDVKIFLP